MLYLDPSHVADEFQDGKIGKNHVGCVLLVGFRVGELDFKVWKGGVVLGLVVWHQILSSK